ncbi:CvpA family protein [Porphyromonas crevioricanis]|uniref:Colicin V production protein n=1 Tax=Porphyromonas crevioricanis TaxID=393921 RepID=A0AB34PH96_9PORP|nr:CvpA family protein [Porphyromonas crevioricanis]KGN96485.1 hypothetical protein HQ38_01510 [Porphyromonas crevioricanis]
MNWLDILIVLLLGIAFFQGWSKGLIRSAGTLLSVILAIAFYAVFSPFLADCLRSLSSGMSDTAILFVSKLFSIVLIVLAVSFVFIGVNKLINTSPLGLFNKFSGGLLHGVTVIFLLSLAFNAYDLADDLWEKKEVDSSSARVNSLLYIPIRDILPTFVSFGLFSSKVNPA